MDNFVVGKARQFGNQLIQFTFIVGDCICYVPAEVRCDSKVNSRFIICISSFGIRLSVFRKMELKAKRNDHGGDTDANDFA